MKKILLLIISFILITPITRADEGIWIPLFLKSQNESEMQAMGMKLSAEDIYSINQACLKDAIVLFGGGCTGEIISDQGLLLTNHHCGYSNIQSHSSLEHNYLTDGFWAMNKAEELPNPGLKVTFLIRMEDVTEKVLAGVTDDMSEEEREDMIYNNSLPLTEKAVDGTHYKSYIKPFYYGNEFYLFVTETFTDVRLVGAPPSNIGKFGGDTDNWMWPRHTGDFSMFRIYADTDNNPAEYSENNVPYTPKYHLSINLKGANENDFTMVFGYPGTTEEYLPSFAIKEITLEGNPLKIDLRETKLNILTKYMNEDELIRIQYSAKYARISNYWKKMIGESRGIKKLDGIQAKEEFEAEFTKWVNSDPKLVAQYGSLLKDFEQLYSELSAYNRNYDYFVECAYGISMIKYAYYFSSFVDNLENGLTDDIKLNEQLTKIKSGFEGHYKNENIVVEKELLTAMISKYYHSEGTTEKQAEIFNTIKKDFDGDIDKYIDFIYEKSIFVNAESMSEFFADFKAKDYKKIKKDPAFILAVDLYNFFYDETLPNVQAIKDEISILQRKYMKAQMEMQTNKTFYPDANSTLRIAYGKVRGFTPNDGVNYRYYTTLKGIMEKENPNIYDYVVEDKLKELYETKDYGRYAYDGEIRVAFAATNHTTGGNSGSPVLDANGYLIGINFDRCWEGTMSDLMYDPDQCRNISLDIRYCLFVIDKFAGAGHLVEEMTIIE